MAFTAIVRTTPDGRVAKFESFAGRAAADAHVVEHGGFVVPEPPFPWTEWKINPAAQSVSREPRLPAPRAPDRPLVVAVKRIAAATGVDISDLDL